MALRTFARFVAQDGQILSADDLTTAMVGRYIAWLDRQIGAQTNRPWSKSSRANVLMQLRQMIDWTKRRHPSRLPARIDFPWRVWPNRYADARPRLGGGDLKAILRACYEEIDEAWDRFEAGRKIIATSGPVDGVDPELCALVRALAGADDGVVPSSALAIRRGVNISAVDRHGGLRHLGGYLHLTGETVAAFFIALCDPDGGQSGWAAVDHTRLPGGASARRASHHRRVGQAAGRREGEARAKAVVRPASPLCGAEPDRQIAGDDGAARSPEPAARIETACSW